MLGSKPMLGLIPTLSTRSAGVISRRACSLSTGPGMKRHVVDFGQVNAAALAALPAVLNRVLPGGKIVGREYQVLNPRRADNRPGSFKINLRTGKWSDFATGDKGGDLISLAAYLVGVSQGELTRLLAQMLGVSGGTRR